MFAYHSQRISHFSEKIRPFVDVEVFPLVEDAQQAFENLKCDFAKAVVKSVDATIPLVVETDASDVAIAESLNQASRPVAFFSRTLSASERRYSAVEKEAYAIVEALRIWKHYLTGRHFTLVTD